MGKYLISMKADRKINHDDDTPSEMKKMMYERNTEHIAV